MRYFTLILVGLFLSTHLAFGQKIMKRKGNMVLFNVSSSSSLSIGDEVKVTQGDLNSEVGTVKIVKLQNGRGVAKITSEKNGTIQAGDQLMLDDSGFGDSGQARGGSPLARGSWLVGGTGGFSSAGGDLYSLGTNERMTTISLNTGISYFVMPRLAVGGIVNLSSSSQGEESSMSLGAGPQVSFYFGNVSAAAKGSVFPFVHGAFLFGRQSSKSTFMDESIEVTLTMTSIIVGGGAMYMLSNSVALIGEATYQIDTYSAEGSSISGNSINLLFGIAGSLN